MCGCFKIVYAVVGVAQLVGALFHDLKVERWIPGLGACDLWSGCGQEAASRCFSLALMFLCRPPSRPSSLSKKQLKMPLRQD